MTENRRLTRSAKRTNRQIAWNLAIAEGRVMRSQGGLSFASFATRTDALEAVARVQMAGMEANIVDPSLADAHYLVTTKIYRCKSHGFAHDYTVCPLCNHQYCSQTWPTCPRCPERLREAKHVMGAFLGFLQSQGNNS